jgi:hypothetical protein
MRVPVLNQKRSKMRATDRMRAILNVLLCTGLSRRLPDRGRIGDYQCQIKEY